MRVHRSFDSASGRDMLAALPGFGPGVHLMTTDGELPVEWLATGDRLITRDHGAQPILWIGRVRVSKERMVRAPELQPVEIVQGALGRGVPTHPTFLAQRSRVLLAGWEVELHAGSSEALADIGALADDTSVSVPHSFAGTHYTYVLLPMHEVVQADGIWVETLLLDETVRAATRDELPAELRDSAQIAEGHSAAARLCLTDWEVSAIRAARPGAALPSLISHAA